MTDDTWEIRSRFMVEEPGKLRMTLKTTAQMDDWEKLVDQLNGLPSKCQLAWELRRQIADMLADAKRVYQPGAA